MYLTLLLTWNDWNITLFSLIYICLWNVFEFTRALYKVVCFIFKMFFFFNLFSFSPATLHLIDSICLQTFNGASLWICISTNEGDSSKANPEIFLWLIFLSWFPVFFLVIFTCQWNIKPDWCWLQSDGRWGSK